MFTPTRCPYRDCPRFDNPGVRFFTRQGSYQPKCRAVPVPGFDVQHAAEASPGRRFVLTTATTSPMSTRPWSFSFAQEPAFALPLELCSSAAAVSS